MLLPHERHVGGEVLPSEEAMAALGVWVLQVWMHWRATSYHRKWPPFSLISHFTNQWLLISDVMSLYFKVANRTFTCTYPGQELRIQLIANGWLHQGGLKCPNCTDLCDVCPFERGHRYVLYIGKHWLYVVIVVKFSGLQWGWLKRCSQRRVS